MSDLTIRRSDDRAILGRLAALDSARPLAGQALIAETCGRPVAAIEIATGRAVADPFERTAEIVEMLRMRARGTPDRATEPRARLLPRPA